MGRAWLLLLLAASVLPAEMEIRVAQGRVDLRAVGRPLAEVLDRLSRQTGMKVSYDGAPPRQPVNVHVERVTEAEAVNALLEGLGVNYALRTDVTGTRVESLVIVSGGPSVAGRPTPAPGKAIPRETPEPDEEEKPGDEEEEEPAPAEAVRPPAPSPEPPGVLRPGPSGSLPPGPFVFPWASPSPVAPAPGASPSPAPEP